MGGDYKLVVIYFFIFMLKKLGLGELYDSGAPCLKFGSCMTCHDENSILNLIFPII